MLQAGPQGYEYLLKLKLWTLTEDSGFLKDTRFLLQPYGISYDTKFTKSYSIIVYHIRSCETISHHPKPSSLNPQA